MKETLCEYRESFPCPITSFRLKSKYKYSSHIIVEKLVIAIPLPNDYIPWYPSTFLKCSWYANRFEKNQSGEECIDPTLKNFTIDYAQ